MSLLSREQIEECRRGMHAMGWSHADAICDAAIASLKPQAACGVCGEDEPHTGTCGGGHDNPRALCYVKPQAAEWLHPKTAEYLHKFTEALAEKLRAAELKYGYSDGWLTQDWQEECIQHMHEHIAKGDPRDVANYCMFLWARGWPTKPQASAEGGEPVNSVLAERRKMAVNLDDIALHAKIAADHLVYGCKRNPALVCETVDTAVTHADIAAKAAKTYADGLRLGTHPSEKAGAEWQPIKTAPKDGTLVVVYWPNGPDDHPDGINVAFDFFCEDYENWAHHSEAHEHYMAVGGANACGPDVVCTGPTENAPYTHWMPLPAAPTDDKEQ